MAGGGIESINWTDTFQNVGIIGGLVLTAFSIRYQARATQLQNQFHQAERHAHLWEQYTSRSELSRVLDPKADVTTHPLTAAETEFVNAVVIHLDCSRQGIEAGLLFKSPALPLDIRHFFALPIPRTIWERTRQYRDPDFVRFVEQAIAAPAGTPPSAS